ncbi:glycosyltransferase [Candidatus Woesebacteria bacterium]|nr:glycosyltransferase [Candidatus Woesebacteria bacterium]
MRKAVVVLPTYNEAKNITEMLQKTLNVIATVQGWSIDVLVVDSKSPDDTAQKVQALQKKHKNLFLLQTEKEGLGKAYINGFTYALQKLNAFVLFEMDSDLSHNPQDIPLFLKKIEEGADFVVGSRYIPGGSIPKDWAFHRKLFSVLANLIIRFGFMRLSVTEWTNGFRAIKAWVVKKHLREMRGYTGYVFQVALLDKAINSGARVAEIPVKFTDRVEGVSKINSWEYIYQTLKYVFLHSSFVKFVIVGLIGFGVDFGLSFVGIELLKMPIWKATLASTETAIVSNFVLNNFWTFSHKKIDHGLQSYAWNFAKFNLVSSGSIVIQTLGVQFASHAFGQNLWWLYKILIIAFIIIPYSYVLYNKIIWKKK